MERQENRVLKTYFPGDRYSTAANAPLSSLHRLLGRWRWSFYLQYLGVVVAARRLAVRGLYDDAAWAESSLDILRIVERNGGRFEIAGIDNLRRSAGAGPFVFIANHMSTLETQILPVLIAPLLPVSFVVKEGLVSSRVFGPIMRSRDPVVVKRRNPREDLEEVLREGGERLRRGVSLVVFPQSTRSPVFRRELFNTLGVRLATAVGVAALPIAVKTDFWGEEGLFRGFGPVRPERTIHIEFGQPLAVSGRGKEQHLEILEFIESRLGLWQADLPA
jgi:1-acyl-sn-glycerol-3-phosphate acyltransferase